MKYYLYLSIVTSVMLYALHLTLTTYFDLPIVGINQAGECVYIDTEQGRHDCNIIPDKYITERVQ